MDGSPNFVRNATKQAAPEGMSDKPGGAVMLEESGLVVPAYPYEGALFLLLDPQAERRSRSGDGYYGALYGPESRHRIGIAASLAALFDKVAIAGADADLPAGRKVLEDDAIEHTDLDVTLYQKFGEWRDESKYLLSILQANDDIECLWHRTGFFANRWNQDFFLKRLTSQVLLANQYGGVLLGNRVFRRFHDIASPIVARELGLNSALAPAWGLSYRDIDFLSLRYAILSIDDFGSVRKDAMVRIYAKGVRRAIAQAVDTTDVQSKLVSLAMDALGHESIARLVERVSGNVGTTAGVAGLIPGIGTVTGIASIAGDLSTRAAKKVESVSQWIHVSSKMKDAIVDGNIRRHGKDRSGN
jgi:hypothetical protein